MADFFYIKAPLRVYSACWQFLLYNHGSPSLYTILYNGCCREKQGETWRDKLYSVISPCTVLVIAQHGVIGQFFFNLVWLKVQCYDFFDLWFFIFLTDRIRKYSLICIWKTHVRFSYTHIFSERIWEKTWKSENGRKNSQSYRWLCVRMKLNIQNFSYLIIHSSSTIQIFI